MDEMMVRSKTDRRVDAIAEAIGGLFSDMFTSENQNSGADSLSVQNVRASVERDRQRRGKIGATIGSVANTMINVESRMLMMQAVRNAPKTSETRLGSANDAFVASELSDMSDDDDFEL